MTSKQKLLYNTIFVLFCGGLLFFLLNAPEETTKKLPQDEDHLKFHSMEKKEAEKFCEECHREDGVMPLPKGHPPKYRCIFCHKQIKKY